METSEEKMIIKFEGQTHQVDLNTLTSSLMELSRSLTEIKKKEAPNSEIKIRIDALAPGSFEVHALVEAINNSSLLDAVVMVGGVASTIVGTYKGFVWLKSKLSGKEIVSAEVSGNSREVSIRSNDGQVIIADKIVFNLYQTCQPLHDSVSNQFRILAEDPSVEGIQISSGQNDSVHVPSESFTELSTPYSIQNQDRKKEVKENQELSVVKPIFEETTTRRWEFIWSGIKISATVEDMEFLKRVSSGEERFGKGDKLMADISIVCVYDAIYDTWLNDTFHIVKVHSHETRKPVIQQKLI
jgi:hypothetical protein